MGSRPSERRRSLEPLASWAMSSRRSRRSCSSSRGTPTGLASSSSRSKRRLTPRISLARCGADRGVAELPRPLGFRHARGPGYTERLELVVLLGCTHELLPSPELVRVLLEVAVHQPLVL